jgi:SynChlorMet cassette radical SAM/SPASM protein ScmF
MPTCSRNIARYLMGKNAPSGQSYPLKQIYFYLTDSCNLKCRHCWISPKYQQGASPATYLPVGLFNSILDQAIPLGLAGVKLTGGEPLLHPGISEIIEVVREKGVGLNVETNGTLLTPGLAKAIAACKSSFVAVSLDGLRDEHEWMRGIKDCFDGAVNGIKALVDAGVRCQVIMTLTRRNYHQMEDVLELAESLKCGSVKFNVMQPTARGRGLYDNGEALTIEELVDLGKWVEEELTPRPGPRVFFDHPMAFRPLGKLFRSDGGGCACCHILQLIGVLADGSYSVCGIGKHIPELVYGNASTDRLDDVWWYSPVIREMREGLPGRIDGVCRDCAMKKLCKGSCIAQNYYTNNSLWSSYWYCDEARKKQLFPESRLLNYGKYLVNSFNK